MSRDIGPNFGRPLDPLRVAYTGFQSELVCAVARRAAADERASRSARDDGRPEATAGPRRRSAPDDQPAPDEVQARVDERLSLCWWESGHRAEQQLRKSVHRGPGSGGGGVAVFGSEHSGI